MTREEVITLLKSAQLMLVNPTTNEPISDLYEALDMAIKSLEQEPKWIPVSERLPENTGLYLINIGDLVTTASFDGHNFRTQTMVRFIPDAWLSLPKPYKAESEAAEQ